MLYIDDTAMIAPINITDDEEANFIKTKTDIPSNFTKLGKHIMISGGSWVFNKKEKGSNNIYGRFRLKSQIPTEDIINCVSFEFSRVGGKTIFKKQHQAMETETPLMLLFICNGTDHSSILSDPRQMLDLAYDDIETNGMMPEEFNNKDIPEFSLRVNVPRMPSNGKKLTTMHSIVTATRARKLFTLKSQRKMSPTSSTYQGMLIGCGSTTSSLENSPSSPPL